jgi:hypothetical protein
MRNLLGIISGCILGLVIGFYLPHKMSYDAEIMEYQAYDYGLLVGSYLRGMSAETACPLFKELQADDAKDAEFGYVDMGKYSDSFEDLAEACR